MGRLKAALIAGIVAAVLLGIAAVVLAPKAKAPGTPGPSAGATPAPGTTPSGSGSVGPTEEPALNCSIPVSGNIAFKGGSGTATFTGGFIGTDGSFAVDPTFGKPALPTGAGGYAQSTYLVARHTWVPASGTAISPAETRYYYLQTGIGANTLHIIDIDSQADHTVMIPADYVPIGFAVEGVYVVHHPPGSAVNDGLQLANVDTGSVTSIAAKGVWVFGAGAPWRIDIDGVARYDVATKALTTWSQGVGWVGFAGNRIVVATPSPVGPQVELLSAPTPATGVKLLDEDDRPLVTTTGGTLTFTTSADGAGTWVTAYTSTHVNVWRVSANGTLHSIVSLNGAVSLNASTEMPDPHASPHCG